MISYDLAPALHTQPRALAVANLRHVRRRGVVGVAEVRQLPCRTSVFYVKPGTS